MRTSTINGVMWMMMAIRDDGYDIGCYQSGSDDIQCI
jgi:hypothetical protein